MSRCKVGEVWNSRLRRPGAEFEPDGQFTIDHIDAQGNFSGTHGGDPINGTCSGNSIHYTRAGKGEYHGVYLPGDDVIRGRHSPGTRVNKTAAPAPDDEWVGTMT